MLLNGEIFADAVSQLADESGETVAMLDGIMQIMEGGGQFDREYLTKLHTCMDQLDPDLWQVNVFNLNLS